MKDKEQTISLANLKTMRRPVRNVNIEHKENLSQIEKFALWITERVGTMGFFFVLTVWTFGWLFWNIFAPKVWRFDPAPAFVLWIFISNMLQLLFLPLIMVGQNLQGRHAEARAETDFEVNVMAEKEIEAILSHLEVQHNLILDILRHLEKRKNKK